MKIIDLRSDTVTLPTSEMREAMAKAKVGDDVYGEDATVNQLQEKAAEMLGKEAGLFLPSGTMGNLAAVLSHCGRGDEVILGNKAHIFLYEAGGISALGGVHSHQLQNQDDGKLLLEDIEENIRWNDTHEPVTRLIALENTHNRCGGSVLPLDYTNKVGDFSKEHGISLHLDGARIFNAAAALSSSAKELASPFDSVTFCLSKGLSAPVGSVLCGSREFITKAHRLRKQLGGGMRQAGILAAAGIVALDKMANRLGEDHARAWKLAKGLASVSGLVLDEGTPHTNMIFMNLAEHIEYSADKVAAHMHKAHGIRIGVTGKHRFRMVLHYWIDDEAVEKTVAAFKELLG
ncbi:MAG: low-specificity L-threonine aldolase [Anaerolineae bacterium]|jgi:threonine aldolase|nr:low-specificity L-threonine aldolase [Anaerolineae bacterium]MBT3711722.1 low-specificity L-threonine aldolase [Anaerolineae bacterium]MBT4309829.1 low-specificity L-threonine aldolase [Anaerolineae bacterium]MBT4460270.1 low-specificity L-threonine aldolase [Anaerolineae bacterium]MBT6060058.1 low-specificity L-threonine aldolase [Anaerolineae bacterium]